MVIWPVKIVSEMTYYVSSGTLNPRHSLTHSTGSRILMCGTLVVIEAGDLTAFVRIEVGSVIKPGSNGKCHKANGIGTECDLS